MKNSPFWKYNVAIALIATGLINYLITYQYNNICFWLISCMPIVFGYFLFCKNANINPQHIFKWILGISVSLIMLLIDVIGMIHILSTTNVYIWFPVTMVFTFLLIWFYLSLVYNAIAFILKAAKKNKNLAHSIAFGIELVASIVAILTPLLQYLAHKLK